MSGTVEPALLSLPIEPKTSVDQQKLAIALQKLRADHPTLGVDTDTQTGQTIIRAVGELQLEMIVDRLWREFQVDARVGKPRVACKETISASAEGDGRFVRQTGGRGHYAHATIRLLPLSEGTGCQFDNQIIGGVVPDKYIESINQGIQEALTCGILAGYPIDDIRIELYDGSYHEADSSEMAFRIAGAIAFQAAVKKANPVLLEPVMRVEVVAPTEHVRDIKDDLSSRRGRIYSQEDRGDRQIINASVPLAEVLGYAGDLRSRTQGRASYSMRFYRYEPCRLGDDRDIA